MIMSLAGLDPKILGLYCPATTANYREGDSHQQSCICSKITNTKMKQLSQITDACSVDFDF
jgi:hypothetical protein